MDDTLQHVSALRDNLRLIRKWRKSSNRYFCLSSDKVYTPTENLEKCWKALLMYYPNKHTALPCRFIANLRCKNVTKHSVTLKTRVKTSQEKLVNECVCVCECYVFLQSSGLSALSCLFSGSVEDSGAGTAVSLTCVPHK